MLWGVANSKEVATRETNDMRVDDKPQEHFVIHLLEFDVSVKTYQLMDVT